MPGPFSLRPGGALVSPFRPCPWRFSFPAQQPLRREALVGSIYGIGLVNGTANSKEIAKIGLSWLLTLPVAAPLSALFYAGIRAVAA